MKNMIDEFKAFIQKGDVVTIAVGLIMALYFGKIVDALLNGVVNPITATCWPSTLRTVEGRMRPAAASPASAGSVEKSRFALK